MTSSGPREPSAEVRIAARELRSLFVALTAESFTPQEALIIIGQIVAANSSGNVLKA